MKFNFSLSVFNFPLFVFHYRFGLSFAFKTLFRRRIAFGVTSMSSSSAINSNALSSDISRTGTRRIASSADEVSHIRQLSSL